MISSLKKHDFCRLDKHTFLSRMKIIEKVLKNQKNQNHKIQIYVSSPTKN